MNLTNIFSGFFPAKSNKSEKYDLYSHFQPPGPGDHQWVIDQKTMYDTTDDLLLDWQPNISNLEVIVGQNDILQMWPQIDILSGLLENNRAFVAGGFFKDIFSGRDVKDIDVFFVDPAAATDTIQRFRSSKLYKEEYSSRRSVGFRHKFSNMLVDLVTYRYGTPLEIVSSFDFTITKFAYALVDNQYTVYHHPLFFSHLKTKRLSLECDIYTINADLLFNRIIRYTHYGFNLDYIGKQTLFKLIERHSRLQNPTSDIHKEY